MTEATDREALARVIEEGWANPTWDRKTLRPIDRQLADAILSSDWLAARKAEWQAEAGAEALVTFAQGLEPRPDEVTGGDAGITYVVNQISKRLRAVAASLSPVNTDTEEEGNR